MRCFGLLVSLHCQHCVTIILRLWSDLPVLELLFDWFNIRHSILEVTGYHLGWKLEGVKIIDFIGYGSLLSMALVYNGSWNYVGNGRILNDTHISSHLCSLYRWTVLYFLSVMGWSTLLDFDRLVMIDSSSISNPLTETMGISLRAVSNVENEFIIGWPFGLHSVIDGYRIAPEYCS